MKKLLTILVALMCATFIYSEESKLLDTSVKSDLEGYDYISNFEAVSDSGYFRNEDLVIKNDANGIAVMAENVPQYTSTNFKIIPAYSSFLNEPNIGAGYIKNAAAIKSITITYRVNRSYDEIFLMYSTSPVGEIKYVKIPQNFNSTQSMVFQTITYTAGNYISDKNKREVKSYPIIGSPANGIYLRGIKVQTNMPTGYMAYVPTAFIQIKEVSVSYDIAKTQGQLDAEKEYSELFGIDEEAPIRESETKRILERNRIREQNAALMDKSDAK